MTNKNSETINGMSEEDVRRGIHAAAALSGRECWVTRNGLYELDEPQESRFGDVNMNFGAVTVTVGGRRLSADNIGRTVFFTKEKAQSAIDERGGRQ